MKREFPQSSGRIVFLDWLRGIAALIMLQGHVFDSFTRIDQRTHGFYIYSQFLGGQAAAIFLFLTGVTYGMGIERRAHLPPWQRVLAALKRARYLFLIAILFRLQMWIFARGHADPADLLRVDVLNLMGAAAALLSLVALAPDSLSRFRWAALAGILMAALAPIMTDFTGTLPAFVGDYLIPGPSFSIFPWGSFIGFGLACGALVRRVPHNAWNRVTQWGALVGFGLVLGGLYLSDLPFSIYPHAQFWLDSPALIACKMGTTLLLAAVSFLWTRYLSTGFSFVRLLGTTSLPVYWVHIELVYGNWLYFFKQNLTPWECIWASLGVVLLMVAMSWTIKRYPWRKWAGEARRRITPAFEAEPPMAVTAESDVEVSEPAAYR